MSRGYVSGSEPAADFGAGRDPCKRAFRLVPLIRSEPKLSQSDPEPRGATYPCPYDLAPNDCQIDSLSIDTPRCSFQGMNWRRHIGPISAALLTIAVPLASPATGAPQRQLSPSSTVATSAWANCGASGYYFVVAQKETYQTSVFGVEANIQRKNVQLCGSSGGSPDWESNWTMLIPRTPGDQYAQAGWIKIGSQSPYSISGYHVFSEFSKACYPSCSGSSVVFTYGPDPGVTKNYQVYLRASDDRIVMRAGSTTLDVFNRDVTGEWSSDWSGQWAAEPHYRGSDVPGVPTNKMRIYGIRKHDSAGNTSFITSFSAPYAVDSARHDIKIDNAAGGGKRIRIWTK